MENNKMQVWTLETLSAEVAKVKFIDRKFIVLEKGDGFLIQMSYLEQDVDEPEKGLCEQKTRKWYISQFTTLTEVIETCWACVCRSQMHIAGEHFSYDNKRVYSPHFSIDARVEMVEEKQFDSRPIKS